MAGFSGYRVAERDVVCIAFAAEIAADITKVNDDGRRRDLKRVPDLFPHRKRALRRSPYVRAAIRINPHDAGVRFDIGLMNRRNLEDIFDDYLGVTKSFFDVAFLPREIDENIAWRFDFVEQSRIGCDVGMKQGRIRPRRGQRIRDYGQILIIDVDHVNRVLRGFFGFGGDSSDFFSRIAHDAGRQDRHIDNLFSDARAREILSGKHGVHACSTRRLVDFDALDAGVSDGTTQHLHPEHPGEQEVRSIDGFAADLFFAFDPWTRNPDGATLIHSAPLKVFGSSGHLRFVRSFYGASREPVFPRQLQKQENICDGSSNFFF